MSTTFIIRKEYFVNFTKTLSQFTHAQWVAMLAMFLALASTLYSFANGYITVYGDSESHLNIAKRVVDSLTPGFAQLGGIWLPLPHILLLPFVSIDFLWRTGLAGAIVSGLAFVISSIYIYKLVALLTKNENAGFFAALVFMLNPNILYLQSTPMTELSLIVFFLLSSYYFILFLMQEKKDMLALILAAVFGFCASLSRYDGWGLVLMEAAVLLIYFFPLAWDSRRKRIVEKQIALPESVSATGKKRRLGAWDTLEGRLILFAVPAFFGIALWLLWGFLILGDPLYFTHSQFSANSQQQNWLARGELPAYHDAPTALLYYSATSVGASGMLISLAALSGLALFLRKKDIPARGYILLILLVPFFFNIATLFLGQSIIFLPGITPNTFEWTLFNVRYGIMMAPAFAIFAGFLFAESRFFGRAIVSCMLALQCLLFLAGFTPVLALEDGVNGLSSATRNMPDAQFWFSENYDHGLVLADDYARTLSILRTPVAMEDVIYIGNKPYWEESLVEPQKYARWIVMQKDDTVWKNIYERPEVNARLFAYFNKVYTSDEILIFRRIEE